MNLTNRSARGGGRNSAPPLLRANEPGYQEAVMGEMGGGNPDGSDLGDPPLNQDPQGPGWLLEPEGEVRGAQGQLRGEMGPRGAPPGSELPPPPPLFDHRGRRTPRLPPHAQRVVPRPSQTGRQQQPPGEGAAPPAPIPQRQLPVIRENRVLQPSRGFFRVSTPQPPPQGGAHRVHQPVRGQDPSFQVGDVRGLPIRAQAPAIEAVPPEPPLEQPRLVPAQTNDPNMAVFRYQAYTTAGSQAQRPIQRPRAHPGAVPVSADSGQSRNPNGHLRATNGNIGYPPDPLPNQPWLCGPFFLL